LRFSCANLCFDGASNVDSSAANLYIQFIKNYTYTVFLSVMNVLDEPRYRQIANALQNNIKRGRWLGGEKLPSVRQLALAHGVSLPTSERALRELEASGMVVARPRSGFYVSQRTLEQPNAARFHPKAEPVTLAARVHEMFEASRTPGVIALGTASPSSEWLPTEMLTRSLNQSLRRLGDDAYRYSRQAAMIYVGKSRVARNGTGRSLRQSSWWLPLVRHKRLNSRYAL
jgi:DNA-binding transcriptional regulator YhcF (GntR family)